MPIRDYDGTTSHQIGSMRDYDGVASHLIYSAEEQYFPGTTPSRYSPGGAYSYTANSANFTNWSCNVSDGTNVNSVTSYLKINMTGIKTITITGSSTWFGGVWLSNQSQFDSKQQQLYQYGIKDELDEHQRCRRHKFEGRCAVVNQT